MSDQRIRIGLIADLEADLAHAANPAHPGLRQISAMALPHFYEPLE